MLSHPDGLWVMGIFASGWRTAAQWECHSGSPPRKFYARNSDASYASNEEALVVCVLTQFDPRSKVWCLKSPGRGEVSAFPFLPQDTILFLFFLYYRSNSQCMFLAATMVPSPSQSGKRYRKLQSPCQCGKGQGPGVTTGFSSPYQCQCFRTGKSTTGSIQGYP